jgi:hypothetical protein
MAAAPEAWGLRLHLLQAALYSKVGNEGGP